MASKNEQLEKWEKQVTQLQERIRRVKARESEAERKADNKRKFLLGAMLQQWMEEDPAIKTEALGRIETFLTRESDRRYFGLGPVSKSAAKSPRRAASKSASVDGESAA